MCNVSVNYVISKVIISQVFTRIAALSKYQPHASMLEKQGAKLGVHTTMGHYSSRM